MAFDKKTLVRDICLILALVLIGLCLLFVMRSPSDSGSYAVVEVDGVIVASYPLSEDGIFVLNGGTNTMEIKDGRVRVVEADCPNQQCVRQMWIDKRNQSIVCLPNRVIITITGGPSSVDFVL